MAEDQKASLDNLMKQAQKMQTKMQEAQEQLTQMEVTGEAGAGMVVVKMNGRHDVKQVILDDHIMDEDKEMIEDLLAAAVNDAVRKIEKEARKKMADLTSSMGLPGEADGTAGGAAGAA